MDRETAVTEPAAQADRIGSGQAESATEPDYVDDELLVEEISIDGMCGVY
jgi:mycofactocin precursor